MAALLPGLLFVRLSWRVVAQSLQSPAGGDDTVPSWESHHDHPWSVFGVATGKCNAPQFGLRFAHGIGMLEGSAFWFFFFLSWIHAGTCKIHVSSVTKKMLQKAETTQFRTCSGLPSTSIVIVTGCASVIKRPCLSGSCRGHLYQPLQIVLCSSWVETVWVMASIVWNSSQIDVSIFFPRNSIYI